MEDGHGAACITERWPLMSNKKIEYDNYYVKIIHRLNRWYVTYMSHTDTQMGEFKS